MMAIPASEMPLQLIPAMALFQKKVLGTDPPPRGKKKVIVLQSGCELG